MNNIFDNLLLISCILCIIVIVNNVVRKKEHLDLIDTSDNNPLIKELKKMKEGFDKLGSIVNVVSDGFQNTLKDIKKAFDRAAEELKRIFTTTCYRSEAQCWRTENGRSVHVGNTPHNTVPYACLHGGAWIREANGAYTLAVDWKDDFYCKEYFPDKCGGGECWMQSR
jgi:hypothetical protein